MYKIIRKQVRMFSYKNQFKEFMQMHILFYTATFLFKASRTTSQKLEVHWLRTAELYVLHVE
jgi:hypothetical protein